MPLHVFTTSAADQVLLWPPLWLSMWLWRIQSIPSSVSPPSASTNKRFRCLVKYTKRKYQLVRLLFSILLSTSWCHTCLAECPHQCDCKWRGGKETAECQKAGFNWIPSNLDQGTQVLDVSDNNLVVLPKDTFLDSGLIHLQRIYLIRCGITQVDKEAFRSLSNLVELDLSYNQLSYVPTAAFKEAGHLRRLHLNGNPLLNLQPFAFAHMPSLMHLELSHCQIVSIAPGVFEGSGRIAMLKLNANSLTTLEKSVMEPLKSLNELHLHENPWSCDCNLRALREWMLTRNVPIRVPPTCEQPEKFKGKTWDQLNIDDYACEPKVTVLPSNSLNILEGDNVTLVCHVTGKPEPSARWLWQGLPVTNESTTSNGQPFLLDEDVASGFIKTTNLTIMLAEKGDTGMYSCVGENYADVKTVNLTLTVGREATEMKGLAVSHITGIVVGITVVIILLIIILCVLTLRCKQPKEKDIRKKIDTNHKVTINSIAIDDQNLSLLGPNPIQKPPRLGQYQGVPTFDVDQYEKEYLQKKSPVAWETQVVVELTKDEKLGSGDKNVRSVVVDDTFQFNPVRSPEVEEHSGRDSKEHTFLGPIVEEDMGRTESEEGDDSGLELDRGREMEGIRSDAESDRERFSEKNRKNQFDKRAPLSVCDANAIERDLMISVPMMRMTDKPVVSPGRLLQTGNVRPFIQRGGSGSVGGGDSTCSSSDPPTVPSSPQRLPMNLFIGGAETPDGSLTSPRHHKLSTHLSGGNEPTMLVSLVVPSSLSTMSPGGGRRRPGSYEDEGEDGTEV
ncbi:hypothetical protein CHUAL_012881 [Chamberlinius hualienensis]